MSRHHVSLQIRCELILFQRAFLVGLSASGVYLWLPFCVSGKRIAYGLMPLIFFILNILTRIHIIVY